MIVLLGGVPYPATLCADVLHIHALPAIHPVVLVSTLYVQRVSTGIVRWYIGRITGSSGVVLYQTQNDGAQFKHRAPLEIRK